MSIFGFTFFVFRFLFTRFDRSCSSFDDGLKKKKILIAGCGTGQQILNYSGINDVDIFAIDISKASLAYAKRKTDQYKIQNIKYFVKLVRRSRMQH